MPHFIAEYTHNIETEADLPGLFEKVHACLGASGVFPLGGIRTRAERSSRKAEEPARRRRFIAPSGPSASRLTATASARCMTGGRSSRAGNSFTASNGKR